MKMLSGIIVLLLSVTLAACGDSANDSESRNAATAQAPTPASAMRSGYAPIGPLNMYYEVHGSGSPLLLIHGAVSTIDTSFGVVLPTFAKQRQVIAIEQQGHGHTADVDRPLSFEQMADDAASLLRHLKIEKADVMGHSDGGNVALALAIRHPDLVRKLVIAGTNYTPAGLEPEIYKLIEEGATKPKEEAVKDIPPQFAKAYAEVAPNPENWPTLVSKVMKKGASFKGWTPNQIRSIAAPTLIVLADRDQLRLEHAAEMFRLHRQAQLAVLPGKDHITLVESEMIGPLVLSFLDAPMPEGN